MLFWLCDERLNKRGYWNSVARPALTGIWRMLVQRRSGVIFFFHSVAQPSVWLGAVFNDVWTFMISILLGGKISWETRSSLSSPFKKQT